MKLTYSNRAALALRFNGGTTSEAGTTLYITCVAADTTCGKLNSQLLSPYYLLSDNLPPNTIRNFYTFIQKVLQNFSPIRMFASYIIYD